MSKKTKMSLIVLFIITMTLYRSGCTIVDIRPEESRVENIAIDPTIDPFQENIPLNSNTFFIKEIAGVKVMLTPLADYKISGRVVSKRHYYMDWFSKLSPVDLAIAWGEFSTSKYDDKLSYSHSDRYYNYHYSGSFEGDPATIGTHSANEHLIPANSNIAKTIKSIKEDEIVELTGQLVNVEWVDKKEGAKNFTTSLVRDDVGAGACEVIYVTKVKIKNKIYE